MDKVVQPNYLLKVTYLVDSQDRQTSVSCCPGAIEVAHRAADFVKSGKFSLLSQEDLSAGTGQR